MKYAAFIVCLIEILLFVCFCNCFVSFFFISVQKLECTRLCLSLSILYGKQYDSFISIGNVRLNFWYLCYLLTVLFDYFLSKKPNMWAYMHFKNICQFLSGILLMNNSNYRNFSKRRNLKLLKKRFFVLLILYRTFQLFDQFLVFSKR